MAPRLRSRRTTSAPSLAQAEPNTVEPNTTEPSTAEPSTAPSDVAGSSPAVTAASSVASTTSKKVRGQARGIAVEKATHDGERIVVTIPPGKSKPVGGWAAEFTSEVGIICRSFAPPTAEDWAHISDADKQIMYQHILDKFAIDLSRSEVQTTVDQLLRDRHRQWRHMLHKQYKKIGPEAQQHPPQAVSQGDWEHLCERFSSERFQKRSKTNADNRAKLEVCHVVGSKSFVRFRHELDMPDRVQFYHDTHYRLGKGSEQGSWICPRAEQIYEQMTSLQSQPTPDGVAPMTADEICDDVLGKRSGYVRGLGHGEKPSSSSTSRQASRVQVEEARRLAEEATRRAEDAERQAQELTQRFEAQTQRFEAQELEMQAMRSRQAQMETYFQTLISHLPPGCPHPP